MEKQKQKKKILNILMPVLVLSIVFWIFHRDYRAIWHSLSSIPAADVLLLLSMGVGYELLDSAVCFTLVRARNPSFRYRQAVDVTFLGIFGNVSTSAAGTIPLQSYYLYRQGVQMGNGIGMMAAEYIFHKGAVVLYALVMMLFQGRWLKTVLAQLMPYIWLGLLLCALIVAGLLMVCTWDKIQRLLLTFSVYTEHGRISKSAKKLGKQGEDDQKPDSGDQSVR